MNFEPKFREHRGFDTASSMRLRPARSVNDVDVIRFVASHHLVSRNAIEHSVHDRPLRGGLLPAARGLFLGKFHRLADAKVAMKAAIHDKNPAPNDVPGLGDALDGATTEAEVHRRLALAHGTLKSADQVRWRHRA